MKNTIGNNISVTLFGESHGEAIGAVIDGLAPGMVIDRDFIAHQLTLRRPAGRISTQRQEADQFSILSGEFEGKATGTPLCISIPNTVQHSKDYSATRFLARPGHADYTAYCKYHGFEDYRGGGHFSGRITAPLVAAGAVVIPALRSKGIYIGTHISRLAKVDDRKFVNYKEDIEYLNDLSFPVLDEIQSEKMREKVEKAAKDGDSVGGILETVVIGMPVGVGEPWFDSVESMLSHILFGVPGIKGVEFGAGFEIADKMGSEANDSFRMSGDKAITSTNNNGGINGGITNGMPIVFRCAVKPTPSIYKKQETIDFHSNTDSSLEIVGRHDPAIIHRARVVVDSVTALCVADLLATRFGTDYLK